MSYREPVKATTADTATAAANTAVAITYTANANVRHAVKQIVVSYSAAPTGGNLTIADGAGTTVFDVAITAAGPTTITLDPPLSGSYNTALVITLAAGGAAIVGKLNARHYTY